MSYYQFNRRFVTVATCVALTLPGCATQGQRIGADDGSDVCRPRRVTLDSTGNFFAEDILKGAALGAAGGGLAGLLAGGNARSALIGAAAGGVLGAAGGYWKARQQQASDQASLYRTISSDIDRENAVIDRTQLAFNQLVDCRNSEASRVRADLQTGRLTRGQAQVAMNAVRERAAGDLRIAEAISGKIQERSNDFAFANDQVNSGASLPGGSFDPGVRSSARPARQARGSIRQASTPAGQIQLATSTNVAKSNGFNGTIATARANLGGGGFELSSAA